MIGGCSSHNQCAALWGEGADYDGWAKLGNRGWTHTELRPLMKQVDDALVARSYSLDELGSWQRAFAEAADVKGFAANVREGIRWNAAFAFLDPVRDHHDVSISAEMVAERLIIQNGRGKAVVLKRGREVVEILADRFVLCAGAFGSPLILMRSGVGPTDQLKKYRIPLQVELPGVGQNLHDHPGIGLGFALSSAAERRTIDDLSHKRFYQSQVILPARSRHSRSGPDLHLLPYQSIDGFDVTSGILVYNLAPHSRGEVRLSGKDARRKPAIDFRFLNDRQDLEVLLEGIEHARQLARKKPLAAAIAKETAPGARVTGARSLSAFVQKQVDSYQHPVGSCKMGPESDQTAVVDASGRVRGLENVWVADASIMPVIPRANTNLSCMLVGLKVAQGLPS